MKLNYYLSFLKRLDWLLLMPMLLLVFIGLASLYSNSINNPQINLILFKKQLIFFILGFTLLITTSIFNYRHWQSYSLYIYIISLFLLVAVYFWGTIIRGTRGWFYIFGFGLQPVEIAKLALVLMLAKIYTKYRGKEKSWKTILLVIGITLLPVSLAILQPDFGSAAILMGIGIGFYLLLSLKAKNLIYIILIIILISIFLWNFILLDYQKTRINTFLNPMSDPLGRGYNVRQSIIAVGSGQLTGRGLGLGSQSQLHFLPETHTDFIFATLAESLGFIGSSLLLILFGLFFLRLILLIRRTKDSFGLYLIYGIALIFFIQTSINIGMNIGIFPVTGISLPFISYGGSFLIMAMLGVGIIENIYLLNQNKLKN